MKSNTHTISSEILEQAADWLVIIHSGEMDDLQQQAFEQWQSAHPDHQKAIERVTRFSSGLSELPKTINQDKLLSSKQSFNTHLSKKLSLVFTPLFLGVVAYQYLPWNLWQADHSSKTGEIKSITLDDGSTLMLASHSYVNIDFDGENRAIELLQGEIYIQTAKEKNRTYRPFIVSTDNGSIQALGTQFSVYQAKKQPDTHVTVYQHAVAIRPTQNPNEQTIIKEGNTTRFSQSAVYQQSKINSDAPYWTQHLLVVENQPLEQVLAEIYRYQTGKYFIDDTSKHIKVSGVYSLKNPKQSIEALAKTYNLQLNYYSDYVLYVKMEK